MFAKSWSRIDYRLDLVLINGFMTSGGEALRADGTNIVAVNGERVAFLIGVV